MKCYQVTIQCGIEANNPQEAVLGVINRVLGRSVQAIVAPLPRVLLERLLQGPAKPLQWWPMGESAQIICSGGHAVALLAETHTIRDNGDVTPSVVCGFEGCTFHAFIGLSGWGEE